MSFTRKVVPLLWTLCLLAVPLAGCVPATALPTPTTTVTSSPTATLTPTVTATPTPRVPPDLPLPYRDDRLTPYGSPHTYIEDSCQYLKDKWSSTNSAPGTVVMTIMFHSVGNVTSGDVISEYDFRQLINKLHDNSFQAITSSQMAAFMETNAKIPQHSVLLIVDDRRKSEYYIRWFGEYWDKWKWPVVNAWISTDLSSADLWQQQVDLENEGRVDHQAHGFEHFPIGTLSSENYIMKELQKPIAAFQEHFNKTPIAVIWPGGGFTQHAVEIARSLGYRLGFTTNPRGAVMFNWVPLGDLRDPQRNTWLPEGSVHDPLLVLPRFWDTDASIHISSVIEVGQEAAAYAEQYRSTELEYYDIVCSEQYGPIP